MVKITGPIGSAGAPAGNSVEGTQATQKGQVPAVSLPDDGISNATSGLLGYRSSPLVSGAIKIFGDGVIFPQNILDAKDPRNDPKYLRLLAAVLGLDELERHFHGLEGEQQKEYLEHKAKQREAHLKRVQKRKEERQSSRNSDHMENESLDEPPDSSSEK